MTQLSEQPFHYAPAMLVTDLDGTLLDGQGSLGACDQRTLEELGDRGVVRVVATGRSPFSFYGAVADDLPIDYAILSSGVGIIDWPARRVLRHTGLEHHDLAQVAAVLFELNVDFMVHRPFPDNHCFMHWRATPNNEDFDRRLKLYAEHATPLTEDLRTMDRGAQFIVIVKRDETQRTLAEVRARLPAMSILRTTSPLDHASTWIEVFPAGVSKAAASAWLAEGLNVPQSRVLGVGNDYNDLDLLEWAGTTRVVANAPEELRARFETTASNNAAGVSLAVKDWLANLGSIGCHQTQT